MAMHRRWMWWAGGMTLALAALAWADRAAPGRSTLPPGAPLSDDMVATVLQHGQPVADDQPASVLTPDGYDRRIYAYQGARYLIAIGGITGEHRMGWRL